MSIAVLVSAAVTIGAESHRPRRPILVYIFKPLTTILILAIALLPGAVRTDGYARAIAVGLGFSLAGDILLMLPGRFLAGLAAFLAGHVSYAFAFRSGLQASDFGWVLLVLVLLSGVIVARFLWNGISRSMRAPVIMYVAAIVAMASLAIGRAMETQAPPALAGAAGALFFMASDTMLALNRFRKPFAWAEAGVLATYFVAQLLIAWSA